MKTVSNEIFGGITYASDASTVWVDLKEQFGKINGSRIFSLHRERRRLTKVNNPKKAAPTLSETFLGLLYPTENYKVYGYLTNTKVKFIMVTTDLGVRDADVRNFFRRFHTAYVDAVSNPFHVPGKKITSKVFAERVSTIVKSFGTSAAG